LEASRTFLHFLAHHEVRAQRQVTVLSTAPSALREQNNNNKMAPANLPACMAATSQDIEMLLAAQTHLGSKNLQVHMEPYLWKTRADGVNVINIGKTW
jgi:hypothetical protein